MAMNGSSGKMMNILSISWAGLGKLLADGWVELPSWVRPHFPNPNLKGLPHFNSYFTTFLLKLSRKLDTWTQTFQTNEPIIIILLSKGP